MKLKQTTTIAVLLLLSFSIKGQSQSNSTNTGITGIVLDASTHLPIEGASVFTADSISVFTKEEGKFELKFVYPNDLVTITADGYSRQIIPVKGRKDLTILLYEQGYKSFHNEVNLEYTVKSYQHVTQSVESESFIDESWKTTGTSADHTFKNSFAGLQVKSRSGLLGNGSVLNIRGINSLNATNRPLIIIDGMISDFYSSGKELISGVAYNSLAGLNIDDIEGVTIIKDAGAIYGAQGGNGVILIETIKANEAATKIQLSSYSGIRYAPEKLPVLNSYDYRSYLSEMHQSNGLSVDSINSIPYMIDDQNYLEYNTYHNETEWQDQIFQDGRMQNYNLKIKGGDNIALYGLSLGYMLNEGIVKNTSYERYSIRFNSEINVSTKVSVKTNISWSSGNSNLMDDGIAPDTNPFHLALIKAPFLYYQKINSVGDISPRYEDADILGVSNPVALLDYMSAIKRDNATNASVSVNYQLSDRLSLSNRVGINYYKTRFNTFIPHIGVADYISDLGVIENTMQNKVESKFTVLNDARVNYRFDLGRDHSLFAIAGTRFIMNQTQEDWGVAHNSPNDEMMSIGQGVNLFNKIGGYIGDWNTLTYYTNLDYDFQKKYFVTLGLSADGSSRFGDEANGISLHGHKFGVFPSVNTAWLISSEEFMQNMNTLSFAKLRVGYGMAGNNDIGNYSAQKYYITQNLMGAQGLISGNLYNPSLQWESNSKLSLGMDLGFFNDRVSLTADLFRNQTKNLLTIVQPDYFIGYDNYLTNFGALQTSGYDLGVFGRIINREFKWDAGINIQHYETIVTEYFNDEEIIDVYNAQVIIREGEPLGQFYGFKTNGVFASEDEALNAGLSAEMPNSALIPFTGGDVIFDDFLEDKIINNDDRQVIGDPTPDFIGNFFTSVSWKGLSLKATLSFSYGNDVYNYLRRDLESMIDYSNQTQVVLNRWKVQDQETNIPKAVYGDPIGNARFSDRWIEDGSYLRLQDVTVNYRLPLSKLIKQSVDIFLTGQNLVTFSNYLGLDPEFSLGNSPILRGIDVGMTPQPKAIFGGIKIGL